MSDGRTRIGLPEFGAGGGPSVVQGHVEPSSGIRCGWANGYQDCQVPECEFPECRCIEVKRERGEK